MIMEAGAWEDRPVRDFDFHPGEPNIRTFGIPAKGILVNDDNSCITQTRQLDAFGDQEEELVLRHYAFAGEWFKLNATLDLAGKLIEPGPPDGRFTVNCDIATPMVRVGRDAAAVDLFLDVLVGLDGSYRIVDRDEFDQAVAIGQISPKEARCADLGLARLLHWIESGRLMELLAEFPPPVAELAPAPLPFARTPISLVPAIAPLRRSTW